MYLNSEAPMVRVFITMFAPDWTLLDSTSFETDRATIDNPIALAALARIEGGKLKRPEGLNDVHVTMTEDRPATPDEARRQRETKGPDSVWFN
jgi:hypothetical protein